MMDELSFIYVGSNARIIILKSRDGFRLDSWVLILDKKNNLIHENFSLNNGPKIG